MGKLKILGKFGAIDTILNDIKNDLGENQYIRLFSGLDSEVRQALKLYKTKVDTEYTRKR
ncbi:MAG: hypothetical protein JW754_02775 [Candidatus Aenigmarchaeota archaeon]|nr:hypothetical protein [Candidatus Aenigmarchaeota archaeon]